MADRRPLMNDDAADAPSGTAKNTPALPSLGFNTSSSSLGFTPVTVSPPLSPRRPGYTRLGSDATAIERSPPPTVVEEEEGDITDSFSHQSARGLGIENTSPKPPAPSRRVSVQTIPRRPIPSSIRSTSIKSPDLSAPNTGDLLGTFPHRSAESTPDLRRDRFSPQVDSGEYDTYRKDGPKQARASNTSLNNDYQQFLQNASRSSAHSIKSAYQSESHAVNRRCLAKSLQITSNPCMNVRQRGHSIIHDLRGSPCPSWSSVSSLPSFLEFSWALH